MLRSKFSQVKPDNCRFQLKLKGALVCWFFSSQFLQLIKAFCNLKPLFSLHETLWIRNYFSDLHEKSSHTTFRGLLKAVFTYIQELYFTIHVKKCKLSILKLFARRVLLKTSLTYTVFLLYKLY